MAEITPCDRCFKHRRCQSEKLACDALLMFTRGNSLERVRFAPRQPTAAILVEMLGPKLKAPARKMTPKAKQKVDELF